MCSCIDIYVCVCVELYLCLCVCESVLLSLFSVCYTSYSYVHHRFLLTLLLSVFCSAYMCLIGLFLDPEYTMMSLRVSVDDVQLT